MGVDRNDNGTDDGAEKPPAKDTPWRPPPDRPGSPGQASRRESKAAAIRDQKAAAAQRDEHEEEQSPAPGNDVEPGEQPKARSKPENETVPEDDLKTPAEVPPGESAEQEDDPEPIPPEQPRSEASSVAAKGEKPEVEAIAELDGPSVDWADVDADAIRLEPLDDEEYAEHVAQIRDSLAQARRRGEATDDRYVVDPEYLVWTDERHNTHREILQNLYNKYADVPCDRKAVIAGGLGGAGKTTVLEGHSGIDRSQYLVINPDDMKEEMARRGVLPEVEGLSPMEASDLAHEESSYLAKQIAQFAYEDGRNVIWDITMSSRTSVESRIRDLRDAGYTIEGVFVDIPIETSVNRAGERHRAGHERYRNGEGLGGRYVPSEVIRENADDNWGSKNRHTFEQLKAGFDRWRVYDNSVDGSAPVLIDSSDNEEAVQ